MSLEYVPYSTDYLICVLFLHHEYMHVPGMVYLAGIESHPIIVHQIIRPKIDFGKTLL
jgi:hypothetical protein